MVTKNKFPFFIRAQTLPELQLIIVLAMELLKNKCLMTFFAKMNFREHV
jgi:hypothetical protein